MKALIAANIAAGIVTWGLARFVYGAPEWACFLFYLVIATQLHSELRD